MLESGIKMEIKSLVYNPEGLIDHIEVNMKYPGGSSSFSTDGFEYAHIEKRLFGMRVVLR